MYKTLGDFIDTICNHYKDRELLYFPTTKTTYKYSSFHELVNKIAGNLINMGLKKSDCITIKSYNTPESLALQWACFKTGIIAAYLNPSLSHTEISNAMGHANSSLLVTDDAKLKKATDSYCKIISFDDLTQNSNFSISTITNMQNQVNGNDIALILFTSGTTSSPKAVAMKHSSIISAMLNFITCVTYVSTDNALICAPFSHMLGSLYAVLTVISFGCKITLLESFKTNRVLETIQNESCTIFSGVPTMFLFLLDNIKNYDLSSLRTGIIAGSNVSKQLYERIYNELGMTELLQSFGQTESLAITSTTMDDNFEKRASSCGKPLSNTKIKIVDINTLEEVPNGVEGEILAYSDCLMAGYLNNKEATSKIITKEGWVRTGDLGYIDNEGYLHVKSRIKDVIIRGGENICPTEVEEALLNVPGIKEASVISVPDKYKMEEICAFIIPSENNVDIDYDFVKETLSKIIAKYKIPRYILSIKSLPKNSSHKIAKNKLKQLALNKLDIDTSYSI